MSGGIDGPVQSVESTAADPSPDHLFRQPEFQQLPPRHHPVLPTGERRHRPVEVSGRARRMFRVSSNRKMRRVFHAADGAERMRTRGARFVSIQSRGAL
jgi:hypothetical protein